MYNPGAMDAQQHHRHLPQALPQCDRTFEAGERGAEGRFPAGTINRLVEDRLRTFAERARGFAKGAGNGGEGVRETE